MQQNKLIFIIIFPTNSTQTYNMERFLDHLSKAFNDFETNH